MELESTTPTGDAPLSAAITDPERLGAILARAGLPNSLVGVTIEPVGTGQMAQSVRLRLTYAAVGRPAPTTLIAKLPSANVHSRRAGQSGFYSREVEFYAHYAAGAGARTPRCYYARIDRASGDFLLLLEDLAPARQGDQLADVSVSEAEMVLREVAWLHASHWGDTTLDRHSWLVGADAAPPRWPTAQRMAAMWDGFGERYETRMSASVRSVGERLMARYDGYLAYRCGRRCLTHNDFRPDNLMFGKDGETPTVWLVDWQTVGVGCGAADVAYFLGGGLSPAVRRAHERQLLERYLNELHVAGVQDYTVADLERDYALNSFQLFLSALIGALIVQQTDRGDAMFFRMIDGATNQIEATGALDLI